MKIPFLRRRGLKRNCKSSLPNTRRRRLRFETLERRDLLAADFPGVVRNGHDWYLGTNLDTTHDIDLGFGRTGEALFAVGDWAGLGRETPGVARPNANGGMEWLLDLDGDPDPERRFYFGFDTDTPVVGDFNGDGKTDVAVVRELPRLPNHNEQPLQWFIAHAPFPADSNQPVDVAQTKDDAGFPGDRPVVGDWDGNGTDDRGVVSRQAVNGLQRWFFTLPTGITTMDFGFFGDRAVVGDWDNDGDDDPGVVVDDVNRDGTKESLLTWLLSKNGDKNPDIQFEFGFPTDIAVPGQWSFPEVDVIGVFSGQPTAIGLGTAVRGAAPLTREFTIRNAGTRPLTVASLAASGDFEISTSNISSPLAAGTSAKFTVRMKSTAVNGTKSGGVSFSTNDGNELQFTFPVSATVSGPEILLYPSVDFHHIGDGQSRIVQLGAFNQDVVAEIGFVIQNTGTADLTLGTLELPAGLTAKKNLPPRLRPGEFAPFTLQMPTEELGAVSGTVRFSTNDLTVGNFEFPVAGHVEFNPLTSEIGTFENGLWFLDTDRDSVAEFTFTFGLPGDVPVTGDWDGDGDHDLCVVRLGSDGLLHWFLDLDGNPWPDIEVRFGLRGDRPIVGDWDGDGDDDPGVVTRDGNRDGFDDANLKWYLDTDWQPDPEIELYFGAICDRPVAGDVDGDGRDDAVIVSARATADAACGGPPSDLLNWYANTDRKEATPPQFLQKFGIPSHTPIMGDWDGDGRTDAGAIDKHGGDPNKLLSWYLDVTDDPHVDYTFDYGLTRHEPVVGRWLPGSRRATIRGYKWHDLNANGNRDLGEPGLPGQTVFLDHKDNGVLDASEIRTQTLSDDPRTPTDESGLFVFDDLRPGTYFVNTVREEGFLAVFPRPDGIYTPGQLARSNRGDRIAAVQEKLAQIQTSALDTVLYDGPDDSAMPSAATNFRDQIGLSEFRRDPRFARIDGAGYAVVLIDTGLDANHPAFGRDLNADGISDRIRFQFDFYEDRAVATDRDGHGSHVTSLALGEGTAFGGLAPAADIIHLKIFPDDPGGSTTEQLLEQALQWTIQNAGIYNIASVNLSLAAGNYTMPSAVDALRDEFATLAALDVIVVAAAGNHFNPEQPGVGFPAADPDVIAVTAVDANNQLPSFAQRRPGMVAVAAPGVFIRGADADGGTATHSGTSQAAPQVAGAAALIQQLAEDHLGRRLTLSEFRSAIARSRTHVADPVLSGPGNHVSYPLLDLPTLAAFVLELPPTNGHHAHKVRVDPTDVVNSIRFGDLQASSVPENQGEIRGRVFHDTNRNGQFDSGETCFAESSVYLDLDNDRQRDANEPLATTDGDGQYAFTQLAADHFAVRALPISNRISTTRDDLDLNPASDIEFAFPAGSEPGFSVVADLNGDGRNDLLVVETKSESLAYWLRQADGEFPASTERLVLGTYLQPKHVAIGDLNGDGRPDLAIANFQDHSVSVLRNDGPVSATRIAWAPTGKYPVGSQPVGVLIGDLVGDEQPDLAAVNRNGNSVSILENHGATSFSLATTIHVGTNPQAMVFGEFDDLAGSDLAVAVKGEDCVMILGNRDADAFQVTCIPVGNGPTALVAHDFDGDGRQDLAVVNRDDDSVQTLIQQAGGGFAIRQTIPVGDEPLSLALGNFDQQRGLDLATTNVASDDLSLLLADGPGDFRLPLRFEAAFYYGVSIALSRVAAGDLLAAASDELIVTLPETDRLAILSPMLTPALRRVTIPGLDTVINGVDFGFVSPIYSWQNLIRPHDVDDNGRVEALDVLTLINYINANSGNTAIPLDTAPPDFYDVDGNNLITALDALLVINSINTINTA